MALPEVAQRVKERWSSLRFGESFRECEKLCRKARSHGFRRSGTPYKDVSQDADMWAVGRAIRFATLACIRRAWAAQEAAQPPAATTSASSVALPLAVLPLSVPPLAVLPLAALPLPGSMLPLAALPLHGSVLPLAALPLPGSMLLARVGGSLPPDRFPR
jgi:hypothetical protein